MYDIEFVIAFSFILYLTSTVIFREWVRETVSPDNETRASNITSDLTSCFWAGSVFISSFAFHSIGNFSHLKSNQTIIGLSFAFSLQNLFMFYSSFTIGRLLSVSIDIFSLGVYIFTSIAFQISSNQISSYLFGAVGFRASLELAFGLYHSHSNRYDPIAKAANLTAWFSIIVGLPLIAFRAFEAGDGIYMPFIVTIYMTVSAFGSALDSYMRTQKYVENNES